MTVSSYLELKEQLLGITHLGILERLLDWDLNVNVPSAGHGARAITMGYVAGLGHEKLTSTQFEDILMRATEMAKSGKLHDDEKLVVFKTLSDFEKAKKLPVDFVVELAQLCGEAHEAWTKARAKS